MNACEIIIMMMANALALYFLHLLEHWLPRQHQEKGIRGCSWRWCCSGKEHNSILDVHTCLLSSLVRANGQITLLV